MPSKTPGDNAAMLADRHAFLDAGFYQPLRDRIAARLAQLQSGLSHAEASREHTVLDLGCGEGYYTAALTEPNRKVFGLDIAKPALALAAKRDKAITWCVGTSRALPFHDNSLDVVISIFCRPHFAETRRVLRAGGTLLSAGPGPDHLRELRDLLYETVYEKTKPDNSPENPQDFVPTHSDTLNYAFTLHGEQIAQLARMTPHYWRAPLARRAQLENISELTLQADFLLQEYFVAKI